MEKKKFIIFAIISIFLLINKSDNVLAIEYISNKVDDIVIEKLSNDSMNFNTYYYKVNNQSIEYIVFTPRNVNSNTKVIIYSTTPDSYALFKKDKSIIDSNLNSIVIIYNYEWFSRATFPILVQGMFNNVKQMYNLSTNHYISDGFSQKAVTSIQGVVDYLKENPTNERQLILLNDGSPIDVNNGNQFITDSDIAILKQNRALIVDFNQGNGYWKNLGSRLYTSGLDILFVSPNYLPSSNFWTNHAYICKNSYASGFYDKLFSFVYDGGSLPSEGYTYSFYDSQTGTIKEYNSNDVKTLLNSSLSDFNKNSSYRNGSSNNTPATTNKNYCYYDSEKTGKRLIFEVDNKKEIASMQNSSKLTFGGVFEGVSYSFFKDSCPNNIYFNICTMSENIYYSITINDITNTSSDPYQMSCKSEKHILQNRSTGNEVDSKLREPVVMNCNYLLGDPNNSNEIAYWLQWILDIVKYVGIITLFGLSTFDFVKALLQNDQDAIKKAGITAAKRFIYCVILFLLPIIIDYAMTLLGAYGTCNIG